MEGDIEKRYADEIWWLLHVNVALSEVHILDCIKKSEKNFLVAVAILHYNVPSVSNPIIVTQAIVMGGISSSLSWQKSSEWNFICKVLWEHNYPLSLKWFIFFYRVRPLYSIFASVCPKELYLTGVRLLINMTWNNRLFCTNLDTELSLKAVIPTPLAERLSHFLQSLSIV